ncbi:MAG: flavodoxin family protein [Gemmiger sp.]
MNVLLINGSPHQEGCTYTALAEVAKALNEQGVETTIFHIGSAPVGGCVGCGGCAKAGKCVFGGPVADVLPLVEKADGLVFGAPVHYATAAGSMLGFLHRLAFSGGKYLRHKPAAVIATARRAGTTTALEAMEKVPQFFEMPLISSTYWPMVHGANNAGADVLQDEEGVQIMHNLGRNMAWVLKCIEAGKAAGIQPPEAESGKRTNFIR